MKRFFIIHVFFSVFLTGLAAQDFIPLWPDSMLPNSKGLALEKMIVNERILQIDTPGFFAFFTSQEENTGCAILICPSGGYQKLTYNLGGFQLAKWFNTLGINAFVLIYRLPNSPDLEERDKGPVQDAQRAMRIIRSKAQQWGIHPMKIGIMGASAGGHLASTLGTHNEDVSAIGDALDTVSFHPDFLILVSPVITMGEYTHEGSRDNLLGESASAETILKYSNELHVSHNTPPCFIVHAADDKTVDPMNSILFYQALLKNNVSGSLYIFPRGGHAINISNNKGSTEWWTMLCKEWLMEMGFID